MQLGQHQFLVARKLYHVLVHSSTWCTRLRVLLTTSSSHRVLEALDASEHAADDDSDREEERHDDDGDAYSLLVAAPLASTVAVVSLRECCNNK